MDPVLPSRRREMDETFRRLVRDSRSEHLSPREAVPLLLQAIDLTPSFYKDSHKERAWQAICEELPPLVHLLSDKEFARVLEWCPASMLVRRSPLQSGGIEGFIQESLRCLLARLIFCAVEGRVEDEHIVGPMCRALVLCSFLGLNPAPLIDAWRERFGRFDEGTRKRYLPPDVTAFIHSRPSPHKATNTITSLAVYEHRDVLQPLGCEVYAGTTLEGGAFLMIQPPGASSFLFSLQSPS